MHSLNKFLVKGLRFLNWFLVKHWSGVPIAPINQGVLDRVDTTNKMHHDELNNQWHTLGEDGHRALLMKFLEELEKEWPREMSELNAVMAGAKDMIWHSVASAYGAGYMSCKGWISQDDLFNFLMWLGDRLAQTVRELLSAQGKKSKCKGIGYTAALTGVSVMGHVAAWPNPPSTER